MPRPPPSVAGKPSTSVPITGTPSASPMIAVCEKASSRDGIVSTVAPAMYGRGSPTQPGRLTREAAFAYPALQGTAQSVLTRSHHWAPTRHRLSVIQWRGTKPQPLAVEP